MKNKTLDFSVMKEEITQNNVLEMAELIAFMELRFQIGYLGSRAQKMYADLYGDIKHKNELGYMLSDSYDLVQEGALYLCENYGKHLNDIIHSKKLVRSLSFNALLPFFVSFSQLIKHASFSSKPQVITSASIVIAILFS